MRLISHKREVYLAALVVLDTLGNQVVNISKAVGIDLDSGGIHHAALALAFGLLGLFDLGSFGRLGVLIALLLGTVIVLTLRTIAALLILRTVALVLALGTVTALLGSLGCLGSLGSGGLHGEDLLHGLDLVLLGHIVKHHVQLCIVQNLGIGLGLVIKLANDLGDLSGGHAKVGGDLLHAILNKTHSINAPPNIG